MAYSHVVDERDRLRAQVDELIDNSVRLSRRQLDMPETPKPIPAPEQAPQIPDDMEEMIGYFESEAVRVGLREQLRTRMSDPRETWDNLRRELKRQLGPVESEEQVV